MFVYLSHQVTFTLFIDINSINSTSIEALIVMPIEIDKYNNIRLIRILASKVKFVRPYALYIKTVRGMSWP